MLSYRRYGKTGKKCLFFKYYVEVFVHAAARGGTCAFTLKIVKHAAQKQLTRRQTFDLDIESTHDQPVSCRTRTMNADDGREDVRLVRGLGGARLPVASYALLSNLKKRSIFCHLREIGTCSHESVFYTLAAKSYDLRLRS